MYVLIKRYPGHTDIGEVTNDDMSAFPEFWGLIRRPFAAGDYICIDGVTTTPRLILQCRENRNMLEWTQDNDNPFAHSYALNAIRLATPEEIDKLNDYIGGYEVVIEGEAVKVGCQEFNIATVKALANVLSRGSYRAKLTINDVDITVDLLNRIINKWEKSNL